MSNSQLRTRQFRSRDEWQDLIEQWQTSGESAPAFCIRHNIGYSTFCKWRQQLNQEGRSKKAEEPSFLDLSSLPMAGTNPWRIVLKLGEGIELQLNRG